MSNKHNSSFAVNILARTYAGTFLVFFLGGLIYWLYTSGEGLIGIFIFSECMFLLPALPFFVYPLVHLYPQQIQKKLCLNAGVTRGSTKGLELIIKMHYFIIPAYLTYNVVMNVFDINIISVLKIHEAIIFSLLAIPAIFLNRLILPMNLGLLQLRVCRKKR